MNIKSKLILSYIIVAMIPLLTLIIVMHSASMGGTESLAFLSNWVYQVLIFALIVLLVILVSVNSANRIILPIKKIQSAMRKVGSGDFKVQLKEKGDSEVSQLARSFNTMVQKLKETELTKSEFLSITSHELKTPLTPIMANLELLQYEFLGPINDQQKEHIELIYRNTQRLKNLINDILDISRLQAGRMRFDLKKENLTDIIKRAIETVRVYANQKNIAVTINDIHVPQQYLDAQRIQQVFINLIGNAIKFSPENSEIKIEIKVRSDLIKVVVSDDGIGMKEDVLKKIFDPFFQADSSHARRFGGTGLGLAICKEIVQSHRGRIWAESTKGAGSRFYVELPRKALPDQTDETSQELEKLSASLMLKGYLIKEETTLRQFVKGGFASLNGELKPNAKLADMERAGLILSAQELFESKILGKNSEKRNKFKKQAK